MDKWLNSHWFARAIALMLAIMMWMVVNLEMDSTPSTEANRPLLIDDIALHVKYDSERYYVVKQPKTVKVALESNNPFYRHNFLPSDSYEVYVDLRDKGAGTHKVPVQYKGWEDAKVGIIPNVVEVTLEEKKTVEREVTVEMLGQVAPGYTAGEPLVKPFRALVRVPESQADRVAAVKASVDVEGATSPIKTTVPLKVVDKSGNVLQAAEVIPLTVEVSVPVTSPYVKVPIKLNLTNEMPDGYSLASVDMNVEEVTVYGPKEVIDALKTSTYPGPEIDLSSITSDRLLELKIPVLENIVNVEPEYLKVSLKVVPSTTKRLGKIPIRISGLSENMQARVLSPDGREMSTIDFDTVGAPEVLQQLGPEDVQVVADVSSMPAGVYEVTLNYIFNQPDYVKVAKTAPKKVTVEITNKRS
ncbi:MULTISPECIES: YbbR-like domain-containing protein [Brevibacillus]|jgi:YbbR domain-containing protein|uniref:CdaR family protein n=1 Tax=Brevibacillus TaxID=55080 RepID=UPI000429C94B|nr:MULTISPECIES: CdaR family protein [Brevibacillus]UYZ13403.1 CdaR family protein [Brevibacillus sp. WF146]